MRLAFWRAGKDSAGGVKSVAQRVVAKPAPATYRPAAAPLAGDLDLRALGQALARKRGWVIVPTVLAARMEAARATAAQVAAGRRAVSQA